MIRTLSALATVLLLASAAAARQTPAASDLVHQAWNAIEPGRGSVCADGSPYRFHVRPGARDRLVIYFNGGGACWSPETCDPAVKRDVPIYVPSVTPPFNTPANANGIFDERNTSNALRDWSMVFVSYCTGDVHIGARRTTYRLGTRRFAIEHKGYVNAKAALGWTYRNFPAAKAVLVAGSSAGAIAAPFYAGTVAQNYPEARVAVISDAAGAYRTKAIPRIFARWGAGEVAPRWIKARGKLPLNIETFFKRTAAAFPDLLQVQYNNAGDDVQGMFLKLLGEPNANVETLLRANLEELHSAIPTFRSYTASGTAHTVLGKATFFTDKAEGAALTDWIGDIAAGRPVRGVDCTRDAAGCAGSPK